MFIRSHKTKTLPFCLPETSEAVDRFARLGAEERGAIFTRREVVEFILDLAEYTTDRPLHQFRLIEPAFGDGDFLEVVVERLLGAYQEQVPEGSRHPNDLDDAIRAFEVNRKSIQKTRAALLELLQAHGIDRLSANRLLSRWLVEGDFLLADLLYKFTHAVGNPPYVRQEMIPDVLMAEYRARFATIYDRADLYVPFIEHCLNGLQPEGVLGFICADRWMKNKYGGPLRQMIAKSYHLLHFVDMVDTPAFNTDVIAYPAITILKKEKPGPTRIAHRPQIDKDRLSRLARAMKSDLIPDGAGVVEVSGIVKGREPWILQSFDQLAIIRRLEAELPTLEDAGCRVRIGVATGADKVYVRPVKELDVEPDRVLPLVRTQDIKDGTVKWKGFGAINPFEDDGRLVDLAAYPRLERYFKVHADLILKRNCAKNNPTGWYRTIDRIYRELTYQPKLLIPDIKGDAHIVYEEGHFYPHHNLYFILSDEWDLKALQSVLRSGIARLFVSVYSTQMHSGYMRFQAQYLRRIRIPRWQDIPVSVRQCLIDAANSGDLEAGNQTTFELYRLTPKERSALGKPRSSHFLVMQERRANDSERVQRHDSEGD